MTATTAGQEGSTRHDQDGSGAAVTGPGCGAVTACHGAARHLARISNTISRVSLCISNTISRVSPCISNTIRAGASPALLSWRRPTSPPRPSGPSPAPLPPSFSLYVSRSCALSLSHFLFPHPHSLCARWGGAASRARGEREEPRDSDEYPTSFRSKARGAATPGAGTGCGGTGGSLWGYGGDMRGRFAAVPLRRRLASTGRRRLHCEGPTPTFKGCRGRPVPRRGRPVPLQREGT